MNMLQYLLFLHIMQVSEMKINIMFSEALFNITQNLNGARCGVSFFLIRERKEWPILGYRNVTFRVLQEFPFKGLPVFFIVRQVPVQRTPVAALHRGLQSSTERALQDLHFPLSSAKVHPVSPAPAKIQKVVQWTNRCPKKQKSWSNKWIIELTNESLKESTE